MTTATTITDPPTEPTHLAPLTELLHPVGVGQQSVLISYRWQVSAVLGDSGAETRRQLRSKPRRTVTYQTETQEPSDRLAMRADMIRRTESRYLSPISCDTVQLSSVANSGQAVLQFSDDLDATNFQVGGRVAIYVLSETGGRAASTEIGVVQMKTSNALTLATVLTATWAVGSYVVPLIETELTTDQRQGLVLFDDVSWEQQVTEVVGPQSLQPLSPPGQNPAGFQTHDNLPILDLNCRRGRIMDFGARRLGAVQNTGISTRPTVFGSYRDFWDLAVEPDDRVDAYDLAKFFDSRAGSTYPFWFMDPAGELDVQSSTLGQIVVSYDGPTKDWEDYFSKVAFTYADGTYAVRDVTFVSRSGSSDTLSLNQNLPSSNFLGVQLISKARFAQDRLDFVWTTSEISTTDFRIETVPDEVDVSELVAVPVTVAETLAFEPDECDVSTSVEVPCTPSEVDLCDDLRITGEIRVGSGSWETFTFTVSRSGSLYLWTQNETEWESSGLSILGTDGDLRLFENSGNCRWDLKLGDELNITTKNEGLGPDGNYEDTNDQGPGLDYDTRNVQVVCI